MWKEARERGEGESGGREWRERGGRERVRRERGEGGMSRPISPFLINCEDLIT